jgi:flagellin
MVSILTNQSAQVALQTLRNVSSDLQETQNRISTGLSVRSAKDNAAYFLVAQTVRGDLSVLEGLRDNLTLSVNAAKTATNGINTVATNLNDIQKALTTADTGQALEELQFAINNFVGEIEGTINATSFNGVNLLKGTDTQTVTTSVVRDGGRFNINTFTLVSQDLDNITEDASLDILYQTYSPDLQDRFDVNGDASVEFSNVGGGSRSVDSSFFTREVRAALDANGDGQIVLADAGEADQDAIANQVTLSEDAIAAGAVDQLEALGIVFADREAGIIDTAAASSLAAKTNGDLIAEIDAEETNGAGVAGETRFMIQADEDLRQELVDKGVVFVENAQATNTAEYFTVDLTAASTVTNPATGAAFTNEEIMTRMVDSSFLRGAADASGFTAVMRQIQVNGSSGNVQSGLILTESLIARVNVNASTLGTFERTLESRQNFLENLTDSLELGVSSLVEADLDEESTKLQAFQVQQQLATQALTIANSQPQNILSLFR